MPLDESADEVVATLNQLDPHGKQRRVLRLSADSAAPAAARPPRYVAGAAEPQPPMTRRELCAVASTTPSASASCPSAKTTRRPGFTTVPVAMSAPVTSVIGRR